MRLTGGTLRGRVLPGRVPAGVRPTSARVREALFSMLGHDLSGWSILDAFGGSGLLGFEAHSRGGEVLIVEKRSSVARQIRQAADTLGADVVVRCADAASVLASGEQWDVVLMDPPYAMSPQRWLELAEPCARLWLVIEHDSKEAPEEACGGLSLDRRRRYGDTTLSLYCRAAQG
ncbi:MAG: 16S rRNA (guanine966-N2)-methyltransferase [Myxococcota bacterium]|jgi:16S rRNA (guanine966-N2)-methyltransferase